MSGAPDKVEPVIEAPVAEAQIEAPVAETPAAEVSTDDETLLGAKPEGDTPAEEAPASETPEPRTPESYKITLPEGMTVDEGALAEFTKLAAEGNFTDEQAQSLVDLYTGVQKSFIEETTKSFVQTRDEWRGQIKADKELGGDNLQQTQTVLARAVETYGDDEARKAFNMTGAGDNPGIVRMIYRMAKALSEGTQVVAPSGAPAKRITSAREALYGSKED